MLWTTSGVRLPDGVLPLLKGGGNGIRSQSLSSPCTESALAMMDALLVGVVSVEFPDARARVRSEDATL
jgi:hypothetical protein